MSGRTVALLPAVAPVRLEGRWVRLEPLAPGHARALLAAASGERGTFGYSRVPGDEEGMRTYIERALAEQQAARALPFATVERASGAVVGSTRFGNIEHWAWPAGSALAREPRAPDAVEIGWTWLAARAQRTAINTEAKLLMLAHAFETWRVHRVRLRTDVRNARSRAAIERLGARLEGVLRAHEVGADGTVRDSAMYSVLASEWPAVRGGLEMKLAGRA